MSDLTAAELESRHRSDMDARLPEHVERLDWSRERIDAERQSRLRELLSVAKARSPWHAARLDDVVVDDLTLNDLSRVPVMKKDDLMTQWDDIVTDRRLSLELVEDHLVRMQGVTYLLDEFRACASGGSSGRRGVFVYDWSGWLHAFLGIGRHISRHLERNPLPLDRPLRHVNLGSGHASHISSMFRTFPRFPGENTSIAVDRPIADIVSRLNEIQPTSMGGYASIVGELANEALQGRLRIAPVAVTAGADPVLTEIEEAVESAWGCQVINVWGSSECGFMAIGADDERSLQLNDDLVIFEPVDDLNRPVPAGIASSKVLVTTLFNHALPVIRYEIDDEFTILESPDPNGSGHRRAGYVRGRADDSFRWSNGTVAHPNVIRSPLSRDARVITYQVHQTETEIHIRLNASETFEVDFLQEEIRTGLRQVGLTDATVTSEFVGSLERTSQGKLKRFVPLSKG